MADQVLFQTPFISLIDRDGYVFSHEKRSDGQIVSLLPFRDGEGRRDYLARLEICPAHGADLERCSITGGVDHGNSVVQTALIELEEEAGYTTNSLALIPLGIVRPSKSSDTTVHLFAVDVTHLTQGVARGDGSKFEEGSGVEWLTYADSVWVQDPLFVTAIARLNQARPPR